MQLHHLVYVIFCYEKIENCLNVMLFLIFILLGALAENIHTVFTYFILYRTKQSNTETQMTRFLMRICARTHNAVNLENQLKCVVTFVIVFRVIIVEVS